MNELTVALLQIEAAGYDQDENLRRGEAACRRAAAQGADIALFPEMWNIGYGFEGAGTARELDQWRAQAVPVDGSFVMHFARLAAELGMAVAVTYLESRSGGGDGSDEGGRRGSDVRSADAPDGPSRRPVSQGGGGGRQAPGPRNSVTLIDRRGTPALTYAKVHTCAFDQPEASLVPGDAFPVVELDTRAGLVSVAAMICFDREFPETARILALEGAELILVPNACPMEENRTAQLRARAYENMVAVALANYPATHPDCDGHSVAFHPCAHGANEVSREMTVVRAGGREQIVLARFDLDELRDWRTREVWGGKYRRPHLYRRLVEE